MVSYKQAHQYMRKLEETLIAAANAAEVAVSTLPENCRSPAVALIRATRALDRTRAAGQMPRGQHEAQEQLFEEARAAGCFDALVDIWAYQGMTCEVLADAALDHELPTAKRWVATSALLNLWSAFSGWSSACVFTNHGADMWDRETSYTWWPMYHHAICAAELAVVLAGKLAK